MNGGGKGGGWRRVAIVRREGGPIGAHRRKELVVVGRSEAAAGQNGK